ncbi:MAG: S26 family signal peptidase [Candidatus Hodarchaeales archaeon]|jgi:signal peptidase I
MSSSIKKKSKSGLRNNLMVKNGFEIIIMISVSFIILFSLLTVFSNYLGTNAPVAVTTLSMDPVYGGYDPSNNGNEKTFDPLNGDLLVIQTGKPQLGDTIVYDKIDGSTPVPIVHRIIGMETNSSGYSYYLTKGDNNQPSDYGRYGWISEEEVVGIVVLRIPSIGWLSLEIQELTMRVFLIVCLGVLLLLMLLEEDEEEEEKEKQKENVNTNKESSGIFISFFKLFSFKRGSGTSWSKKIFSSQLGNIFLVFLIIFVLFSGVSFTKAYSNNNHVNIVSQGPYKFIPGPINGSDFYFLKFNLEINSQGYFNWIYKIETRFNNSEDILYVWNIPYSYNHELEIKAGIMVPSESITESGDYTFNLRYTTYSSGILAQDPYEQTFSLKYSINV